ncbi:MAG: peptidoglycan-binding domain-containing protein [Candidatus Paceibacterota bacterium]|jgi:peptidoglycan hydrolase-like protein with peptidoglycan-binding domain
MSTNKIVAAAVGFSLAFAAFVGVGAASAGAQSMTLSQLVDLFISLGIISSDKAAAAKAAVTSSATVAATTFSKDLTIGSTGADVSALQAAVGVTPATGYFGAITKAAVQAYQTSKGISATGYVGPLTRAALNGSVTTTTTTTTTTPSTTTTTTVVNSGVEGILTADKASISNSTVYEGDTMHTVLGIKLQARLSDINVQRVRLNLGADTSIYTKAFKTMYLVDDAGKVIAQADLNSNTVVKDSSVYLLTFGGFNYAVAKDTTKYLWVKADAYSSFKTTGSTNCASTASTCTIALADSNGVRGVDGAGIDQNAGGTTGFAQTITLQTSLIENATLDLSVSPSNVKTGDVVASEGANNDELDQMSVLVFDVRANKDSLDITDLTASITSTAALATATTAYLYDGSTLVQTESINGTTVTFSDISNLSVAKDTTKSLTLKIDVRSAVATPDSFAASIAASGITAENSLGTTVRNTSAITGENQIVRNAGPVFTLKSIVNGTPSKTTDQNGQATSTLPVTFNLNIAAKGSDITFGANGGVWALATTGQAVFYENNVLTATSSIMASGSNVSVLYTAPSTGVTNGTDVFTLAKGANIDLPVIVSITVGKASGSAAYSVGFSGFNWGLSGAATTTSTFMSGKTEWRSTNVTLP